MKQFYRLIAPYFYGDNKSYARWGAVLLLLLTQVMTSFGYFFIQWNRRFYDALESRSYDLFIHEMFVFAGLAISFGIVSSLSRYYCQTYALRWRLWMTERALGHWLPLETRNQVEGSDQRIQEDLMRFTMIFEKFVLDFFNSIVLIIVFTPMLYAQTKNLYLFGYNLCWLLLLSAIIYTALGLLVASKIANPLIQSEYDNQKLEAEFRYNLVHARDGEKKSLGFFNNLLRPIANNYSAMYQRHKLFNMWQQVYNQLSFLVPFVLLGSNYFAGMMTLGMLMQAKSTFSRIRNSMAYLFDNYTQLTDIIAITKRLLEFYAVIEHKQPSSCANTLIFSATNLKKDLYAK